MLCWFYEIFQTSEKENPVLFCRYETSSDCSQALISWKNCMIEFGKSQAQMINKTMYGEKCISFIRFLLLYPGVAERYPLLFLHPTL